MINRQRKQSTRPPRGGSNWGATHRRSGRCVRISLALLISITLAPALAGPRGGKVVSGKASITRSGSVTNITAGDRAIINFKSFNIAPGETVRFIQPNSNARVLNRVINGKASQINGALIANGRVYLVNPAGVFFGGSARVSVAQLTAAAGTITDRDFLNGVDRFTGLSGTVRNEGVLNADAVTLLGRHVHNVGSIVAPDGMITLAAGDAVYLAERDGRMMVQIDTTPGNAPGSVVNDGVLDAGTGGAVSLSAGDVYALAVNQGSTVRAADVAIRGGAGSDVTVAGTIETPTDGALRVAGGDIAASAALMFALAAVPGDITVVPATIENAAATVLLEADGDIIFDMPVSMNNNNVGITARAGDDIIVDASITTRGGTLDFTANDTTYGNASGAGAIKINAPLDTTGGGRSGGSILLAVDGGTGAIEVGADLTASNALTFNGPVVLTASPIAMTVTGRPGIRFNDTLRSGPVGDVDLDLTVLKPTFGPSGDITFVGLVGGLSGADRLGQVTVHNARNVTADSDFYATGYRQNAGFESTRFRGLLSTAGQSNTGEDGGEVYIRTNDDIYLTNVDTSGAINAGGAGGAAGDVTLLPDDGDGAIDGEGTPDGVIFLLSSNKTPGPGGRPSGSITALGGVGTAGNGADGAVRLNVDPGLGTDGRNGAPSVATVSGDRTPGSDFKIDAGSVEMGQNVKATFYGNLEILTSGDTTLGDVNTLGDLTVTAGGDINIKSRDPQTLWNFDFTRQTDEGVDFVIGGRTDFNKTPNVLGGGADPRFSSPGGVKDISGTLGGFVLSDFGPIAPELLTRGIGNQARTLDLAAAGPSTGNIAEALASSPPDPEFGKVPRTTEIGKVHKDMLEQLGILTRDLTPAELVWMLNNRRFYNDLDNRVAPDKRIVAAQRLLYTPVEQVIIVYRDLFFDRIEEEGTGRIGLQPRKDKMKAALTSALAEANGKALGEYIVNSEEHAEARAVLNGLHRLYRKMDNLALTPNEIAASKRRVYGYVLPDGMTGQQLEDAIRTVANKNLGDGANR